MRRVITVLCLLAVSCSPAPRPSAVRVVATPIVTPSPVSTSEPPPTPTATPVPTPPPATAAPAPVPPSPVAAAFRGLGSWIDVFDYTDDPNTIVPLVRGMAKQGVTTLYLETARYQSTTDVQFPRSVGAALDEAKALGMRVVAWYPPAFDDVERDVRRSVVAVRFVSPKGNHFDAFGADIEYTQGVPDHAERNRRAVDYSRQVRTIAGAAYPLAGIVIPPLSLQRKPDRWPGFPWKELSAAYDVFMPMNYWTAYGRDPGTAADLTTRNTAETKRLTGKPVHTIGGLAENADEAQVTAYVVAARESGSVGGGLYDYKTTRPDVWDRLRSLE